ncbi:hypothetical protein CS063_12225 [Sporanaerobium hydrogeniformans]|uniref:Uncharacterized protein n=1 Tax=Sporanaerobium hydrogeniformans TaxID=3072179 RepID=A0AC61DA12_9FIRM|nr:DUF1294 domain-containing protein [Sporanaerobium hydrogeniformans]PHV70065.1 hypothetical protein CS063_12225 [Sporanaerobium hydrogeniformans]
MDKYIVVYLSIINVLGLWSMFSDKKRAQKQRYRWSEKSLFLIALLGGSLGSLVGMHYFRHKTKHWYFMWGIPIILCAQVVLGFWLAINV